MRSAINTLILATILVLTGACGSGDPISSPARLDESGENATLFPGQTGMDGIGKNPQYGFPTRDTGDRPKYADGEVLIVPHDTFKANALYPMAKSLGLSLMEEIKLMWGTVYRMRIDDDETVESMVATLKTYPEVRYAEPNYIMYHFAAPYFPNDPLFETDLDADDIPWNHPYDQWGPNVLGASLCWPDSKGSTDVIVAVLDTGAVLTHEDLVNQLWINEDEIPDNDIDDDDNGYVDDWRGYTFMLGGDPWDWEGHGTACVGIVGAEQDNHKGCTGIAPGCKVMVLSIGGWSYFESSVIQGAQYAYDNGADILSMSFGTDDESEILHETFIAVYDDGNGLLLVASAGNDDTTQKKYPTAWPEIVTVGATCSFYGDWTRRDVSRITSDIYGWGSSYGEHLEVMAPGLFYITTAHLNDQSYCGVDYPYFGGTSCASPCIAGCFALLKTHHPDWTALQLRQRLRETCDDLYEIGHDIQSGYGRVNVYRAIYGSEPNADLYDTNGHIKLPGDENWFFDNIFDIPTSADYDNEDIFVVECDKSGLLKFELDIITTGEDLDFEVYDNPEISGTPVAAFYGPNGEDNPTESLESIVSQGERYYLRVFSPAPGNCSNYGMKLYVEPYSWWIEWESIAPELVLGGSDELPLLKLEFHTSLAVTPEKMQVYLTGDFPLELVNRLWLYEDTNGSGAWEPLEDAIAAETVPSAGVVKQVVFDGLDYTAVYEDPVRYFVIADIGPHTFPYNLNIGVALKSYKDIDISEHFPLLIDPFPIISDQTIVGETYPPYWEETVGVQFLEEKFKSVVLYWNNAIDDYSIPVEYNVYWDDEFPPEIDPEKMIEHIDHFGGGEYHNAGIVTGLENEKTYYFCVRAVDAIGNEDDNEVFLTGTPNGIPDPLNPVVIGEIWLYSFGDFNEVCVHDKIAYIGTEKWIPAVDCTSPENPVHIGYAYGSGWGITYYEDQDLIYAVSYVSGLRIIDPEGLVIIGSCYLPTATDVFVDNDIAYVVDSHGLFNVINSSEPTYPHSVGWIKLGTTCEFTGLAARGDYAYCCTTESDLIIMDVSDPTDPQIELTFDNWNDSYEIQLWGDYALVTSSSSARLSIIDISDPPNATMVGSANIPDYVPANGLAVRDDQYVYVGTYSDTIWTFEWDDFDNIQPVGSIDIGSQPVDLSFDGEFLYVVDNEKNLKIIL